MTLFGLGGTAAKEPMTWGRRETCVVDEVISNIYLRGALSAERYLQRLQIARRIDLDIFVPVFVFGVKGAAKPAHCGFLAMNEDLKEVSCKVREPGFGFVRCVWASLAR
jgi:hypothetical protein